MASTAPQAKGTPLPEGVLVVDKAAGFTSHDVVARVRSKLGQRRTGHAGTLDPDATGVLVLGLGRATRLLRFATALKKSYVGDLVLGTTTTTLDAAGEVTGTFDMAGVGLEDARAACAALTGRILQVPPMVSAVKVGGKRLHELARAGIEIERQARPVEVHRFELEAGEGPGVFSFVIDCSSGTYVRVLAADLGAALGGGAHLARLRRTAIGPFSLDQAVSLDELEAGDVKAPNVLVAHLAQVVVDADVALAVGHGKVLDRRVLGALGEGPWAVLTESGELLGVYESWEAERTKPTVVLAAATPSGDEASASAR